MKFLSTILFLTTFFFVACEDDGNDIVNPIEIGSSVTIRNTLQTAADVSQGGTGEQEFPIEDIFGVPAGTFELTATVSDAVEFSNYLNNLYDVDLSRNTITFTLVASQNDPFYSSFFRIIEVGTFDRYYLTFPGGHNIESATSTNSSVSLNIISSNEVVVVIGEGWNFNPGSTFTLNLN